MKAKWLTVTTGWGQGKKGKFVRFAEGKRGIAFQHVGPSTSIATGVPGAGDAIVDFDGEHLAAFYRNLDPMPARIVVVKSEPVPGDSDLENPDSLDKVADLGLRFFPHVSDHKKMVRAAKRLAKPYGEFAWWNFCQHSATVILGVR